MKRTIKSQWQALPAIAGAWTLAALTIAASTLTMLPDSAAAQGTAAQRNAVRHYCRADLADKCPGVSADQTILCLEANLEEVSRTCKKAVLAILPGEPASEPVADAAPPPPPRATSRTAPIVSTAPPRVNSQGQRVTRRGAPAPAANEAPPELLPPNVATPRKAAAARGAAATPESLPPNPSSPGSLRPESEQADTRPPKQAAPDTMTPARRPRSTASRSDPLVQACWNELVRNCRGMRPGGGREFACLTRHSRSLSARCWDAYRTAWSRRR